MGDVPKAFSYERALGVGKQLIDAWYFRGRRLGFLRGFRISPSNPSDHNQPANSLTIFPPQLTLSVSYLWFIPQSASNTLAL
ncbi:MAG: hypothetical protein ACQCN6_06260 [Candidatus Bathyarchaeia archaeon]|jgi:hypothetical protein